MFDKLRLSNGRLEAYPTLSAAGGLRKNPDVLYMALHRTGLALPSTVAG